MRDLSPSKILLDRTGHVSLIQNLSLLDNNLGQSLDLSCEYMGIYFYIYFYVYFY